MNPRIPVLASSCRAWRIKLTALFLGPALIAAAGAADAARGLQSSALALFVQDQTSSALSLLEAQTAASSPTEKDLLVAQHLTRIAFTLHNRRDQARAGRVAALAIARTAPRVSDAALSPLHFAVFREQALACDLILGDAAGALLRVDAALRYVDQRQPDPAFDRIREELRRQRQTLSRRFKVQQRPS